MWKMIWTVFSHQMHILVCFLVFFYGSNNIGSVTHCRLRSCGYMSLLNQPIFSFLYIRFSCEEKLFPVNNSFWIIDFSIFKHCCFFFFFWIFLPNYVVWKKNPTIFFLIFYLQSASVDFAELHLYAMRQCYLFIKLIYFCLSSCFLQVILVQVNPGEAFTIRREDGQFQYITGKKAFWFSQYCLVIRA